MTGPGIDYQAVLADLEAKRGQLDAAIAGIKAMLSGVAAENGMASPDGEPGAAIVLPAPKARPATGPLSQIIENDTFFGMSTAAAVRKFLAMTKRPQSPRVIADSLHRGGQEEPEDGPFGRARQTARGAHRIALTNRMEHCGPAFNRKLVHGR